MDPSSQRELHIPIGIVGQADVSRLLREITYIEDFLHQAELRQAGQASVQIPRLSRLLNEFAEDNKLNVLKVADRAAAIDFLKMLKLSAPTIHISFAAEPSGLFVSKLITWLRAHIHPQLLLQIGLQPALAAGCVVRTPNKYFDFSLRARFDDQRLLLISKLEAKP